MGVYIAVQKGFEYIATLMFKNLKTAYRGLLRNMLIPNRKKLNLHYVCFLKFFLGELSFVFNLLDTLSKQEHYIFISMSLPAQD